MKYLLPALLLLLFASACVEETLDPNTDYGQGYFPLELGKSWYYDVDSIELIPVINGTFYDTSRLEVRETLLDTFTTPDRKLWYRGERWERTDAGSPWQFKQTFALSSNRQVALRQEDNLTFTKLTFAVRNGTRWDGHTAFDEFQQLIVGGEFLDVYAGWEYSYANVDEPVTLATGFSADKALLVEQAEVDNLLDFRFAYERYADGIGLIERYIDARHTQCRVCCNADTAPCLDLPWDEKAEKGFILHQVLTRYE